MEHLLFTGATAPIVIPYFCTEDWDSSDFLTYPKRKGWDLTAWEPSDGEFKLDTGGRSFEEISAFLQTWLFFGLLESVLGIRIPREDFIRQKKAGKDEKQVVITTRKLKHYLEDWRRRMAELTKEEQDCAATVIWEYLSRAMVVNGILNFQLFYGEDIPESKPLLESLFCQTLLNNALRRALLDIIPETNWSALEAPNHMKLLSDRMVDAGWCPYTVGFLEDQCQPDVQAFVYSLGTVRAQQDHTACKAADFNEIGRHCVAGRVEGKAALEAKHVSADCKCESLGPPAERVIELIEEGLTPCVAISTSDDNDDIEILVGGTKLEPESEVSAYFALSHVWTDGLGNHEHNSLPACQVRRLAGILHALDDTKLCPAATSKMESNLVKGRATANFWLDTLCIPVQSQFHEYRDRCIHDMHQIYREAVAVVVLDPDLQQATSVSKPVEIVARLLCSVWKTRLWTYQEGSLALDLYLAGKDCLLELSDLTSAISEFSDSEDEDVHKHMNRDIVEFQITRSIMIVCRKFIMSFARWDHEKNPESTLDDMLRALSHRGTSRPDDEAICIATFMHLDPAPLLDALPRHRMTMLLQMLPWIPKSALFAYGPRQQTPGFRWAPLTFMTPYGIKNRVVCSITYAPDLADPKASVPIPSSFLHPKGVGLAVFLPGMTFAPNRENSIPENFAVVTPDGTGYVISFHDTGSDKIWVETSPNNFTGSGAIILSHHKSKKSKYALLVEMLDQKSEEGYPLCRWRCQLTAESLDDVVLEGKIAKAAEEYRFTGEFVRFQWWVID
ncbi:hypothetical protein EPUS_00039 [Endocarpon pusillum Z07020]|uniref:Heterokaryon incompatibility domain-containing protein n=1 Tax=Endocarpon pusillum (strain Z07020 / HMAS-L-300199) TaxID=1263415 RepID=U1GCE1_ENDPU|nr:uncharacterized protein EPUS_00039 [Endocarpon pusillum Z07020]ERF75247.1 hypothetical protein EPUS_00039 [Endocarpon pusillum Z07020]